MADHLPIAHIISYVRAKADIFRNRPDPYACAGFGCEAPVAMRGNDETAFEPSNARLSGQDTLTKGCFTRHVLTWAPLRAWPGPLQRLVRLTGVPFHDPSSRPHRQAQAMSLPAEILPQSTFAIVRDAQRGPL